MEGSELDQEAGQGRYGLHSSTGLVTPSAHCPAPGKEEHAHLAPLEGLVLNS